MIHTVSLFPVLNEKLIQLLRSLTPEEWNAPTVARLWKVKDVVSHLLDGNLRLISIYRDGYMLPPDRIIDSYQNLVAYLNQLNSDWVTATKRLSPEVLTDLLESTGKKYDQLIAQQDPHADAVFSVAWAGEEVSENWFHIAREYTEKWHHQQQIRDAVSKPGIMTAELFQPVMDTFLRGLPHVYKDIQAAEGCTIEIHIDTSIGGYWYLQRTNSKWEIQKISPGIIHASLTLQPDLAWKLFTKAVAVSRAEQQVSISGDTTLARHVLGLLAVMA